MLASIGADYGASKGRDPMTPPTPKERVCPDCGSDEISRHSFEECCAILKQQRNEMKEERDALQTALNSEEIRHDEVLDELEQMSEQVRNVSAKLAEAQRERDRKASWVEEQADIISRGRAENAQLRAKLDAAVRELADIRFLFPDATDDLPVYVSTAVNDLRAKLAEVERERGDADDALAACQAQAAGTIARLREKLDALTAHMNQVHETLGGAEKDAARWRFVRDNALVVAALTNIDGKVIEYVRVSHDAATENTDAALDTARTAATAQGDTV
jgi:DNA repair exonuclease SbcCD ATPase subunit